jgi:hypothetical protein
MRKLIVAVLLFAVGCGNNPVSTIVPNNSIVEPNNTTINRTAVLKFDIDTTLLDAKYTFNPSICMDGYTQRQLYDTSKYLFSYSKIDTQTSVRISCITKVKFSNRIPAFGSYGILGYSEFFEVSKDTTLKIPRKICKAVIKNIGNAKYCKLILKDNSGTADSITNGYYSGMYPTGHVAFYAYNDTARIDTLRVFIGDKIYVSKKYYADSTSAWSTSDSSCLNIQSDTSFLFY